MKLFIVCISFFLSNLVFASGCELNNISCKFAANFPYQDLVELLLWLVISLTWIGFIFYVYDKFSQTLDSKIEKSKRERERERENEINRSNNYKQVQEFESDNQLLIELENENK